MLSIASDTASNIRMRGQTTSAKTRIGPSIRVSARSAPVREGRSIARNHHRALFDPRRNSQNGTNITFQSWESALRCVRNARFDEVVGRLDELLEPYEE